MASPTASEGAAETLGTPSLTIAAGDMAGGKAVLFVRDHGTWDPYKDHNVMRRSVINATKSYVGLIDPRPYLNGKDGDTGLIQVSYKGEFLAAAAKIELDFLVMKTNVEGAVSGCFIDYDGGSFDVDYHCHTHYDSGDDHRDKSRWIVRV